MRVAPEDDSMVEGDNGDAGPVEECDEPGHSLYVVDSGNGDMVFSNESRPVAADSIEGQDLKLNSSTNSNSELTGDSGRNMNTLGDEISPSRDSKGANNDCLPDEGVAAAELPPQESVELNRSCTSGEGPEAHAPVSVVEQELQAATVNLEHLSTLMSNGVHPKTKDRALAWHLLCHYMPCSQADRPDHLSEQRTKFQELAKSSFELWEKDVALLKREKMENQSLNSSSSSSSGSGSSEKSSDSDTDGDDASSTSSQSVDKSDPFWSAGAAHLQDSPDYDSDAATTDSSYFVKRRSEEREALRIYRAKRRQKLLDAPSPFIRKQSKTLTRMRQVKVDVLRMCPSVDLFQQERIRSSIERVLYTYAAHHEPWSYVQGMDDILGPIFAVTLAGECFDGKIDAILLHQRDNVMMTKRTKTVMMKAIMEDISDEQLRKVEADAYYCFAAFIDRIQDHYHDGQPGVHRCVKKLDELMRRQNSSLHQHFVRHDVELIQFTVRWMNCLLLRDLNFICGIRVLDALLAEEQVEDLVVALSAAVLDFFSDQLKKAKAFEDLIMLLQALPTKDWTIKEIDMLLAEAQVIRLAFMDEDTDMVPRRGSKVDHQENQPGLVVPFSAPSAIPIERRSEGQIGFLAPQQRRDLMDLTEPTSTLDVRFQPVSHQRTYAAAVRRGSVGAPLRSELDEMERDLTFVPRPRPTQTRLVTPRAHQAPRRQMAVARPKTTPRPVTMRQSMVNQVWSAIIS